MNSWTGIGRCVRDIELKYLQNGTATASFTIAIDKGLSKEKKQEFENQNKPVADFINIVTWGKTAEFAATYLKKGAMVGVSGRLQSGKYTNKEGQVVYTTDVNCSEITMIDWGDKQNKGNNEYQDFHPIDNDDIPF